MKNNILIIVTILIITCLTSCADKQGNGNIVTKNINISDYSEIEISAPVTLEYSQEDSSSYFEITAYSGEAAPHSG